MPLAADLSAAPEDLQLVASAYAGTFGGLLLFAAASVLCAVAWSVPVLVTGRALQGAAAGCLPGCVGVWTPAPPVRPSTTTPTTGGSP